jgi:hypothetical protein
MITIWLRPRVQRRLQKRLQRRRVRARASLLANQPSKAKATSLRVKAVRDQHQRLPHRLQMISRRFVAGDSEHDFPLKQFTAAHSDPYI